MSNVFFERHQAVLQKAVETSATRGYWSPYPESASPRNYGETAQESGKAAFDGRLNKPFFPPQAGTQDVGAEKSPYGFALGVTYPKPDLDSLFVAIETASAKWRAAGPEAWAGVSLEILDRLNKRSFEIAYSVMHTTGQAFMMAFQAGGPHAQDRGLEAVAYAWSEMSRIPKKAVWEKPQGKSDPLRMEKTFNIVPRGVGLVIGCCTFPTWNSYPGLFANLATGNAVIVKPHPGAILPLAITVEIARDVLREAGFDPNVVTLAAHEAGDPIAKDLALRPEVKIIDFTGSSDNGNWLERNAHQALVYTEKAGVNQIIIDSTNDFKGMLRNIAFSLSLYSGQMCTAPQNIYVPRDGIDTAEGHMTFDQVAAALGEAVAKLTTEPGKAVEFLGAIQNQDVIDRINHVRSLADVVVDSRALQHPAFPEARIQTPLIMKVRSAENDVIMQEFFGPISFVVATNDTQQSIKVSERAVREHGALTLSVYSSNPAVLDQVREAASRACVALSINLTGGVFVNQSAAFSDFHGTGGNPAANASLADTAFVANRFRVAQSRVHI